MLEELKDAASSSSVGQQWWKRTSDESVQSIMPQMLDGDADQSDSCVRSGCDVNRRESDRGSSKERMFQITIKLLLLPLRSRCHVSQ